MSITEILEEMIETALTKCNEIAAKDPKESEVVSWLECELWKLQFDLRTMPHPHKLERMRQLEKSILVVMPN